MQEATKTSRSCASSTKIKWMTDMNALLHNRPRSAARFGIDSSNIEEELVCEPDAGFHDEWKGKTVHFILRIYLQIYIYEEMPMSSVLRVNIVR